MEWNERETKSQHEIENDKNIEMLKCYQLYYTVYGMMKKIFMVWYGHGPVRLYSSNGEFQIAGMGRNSALPPCKEKETFLSVLFAVLAVLAAM